MSMIEIFSLINTKELQTSNTKPSHSKNNPFSPRHPMDLFPVVLYGLEK